MKQEGLLTADSMINWKKKSGLLRVAVPPKQVILCPQDVLPSKYASLFSKKIKGLLGRHLCIDSQKGIYLSTGWGTGASAMIAVCEELRALGTSSFILIGLMGRLTDSFAEGELVCATSAWRSEGTSQHYLGQEATSMITCPSQRYVELCADLGISEATVASTDAPYRETSEIVNTWKKAGCSMVDMETSALYAFAQFYNIESMAIGIGADRLYDDQWSQAENYQELVATIKKTAYQIADRL